MTDIRGVTIVKGDTVVVAGHYGPRMCCLTFGRVTTVEPTGIRVDVIQADSKALTVPNMFYPSARSTLVVFIPNIDRKED